MSQTLLSEWTQIRAPGAPPRMTLGAMNFGKRTPAPLAKQIIARAEERGLVFIDTANAYNEGESERIVGSAVAGRRSQFVIASKVGLGRVDGKAEGLGPERVLRACDESLSRLGTEYIDVYYLHAPDPRTPIEKTLSALATLFRAGKIHGWGVSNFASWQILEMFQHADALGLPRPAMSQVIYNLLVRQIEIEYTRFAAAYRLHTTVYNPLAGGLLSGRYRPGSQVSSGSRFDNNAMYQRRYFSDRMLELAAAYEKVAAASSLSLVELAYAWVAAQRGVDSILVGPGSLEHLDAAIDGCQKSLSPELAKGIEAIHRDYLGTDATYAR
jgi:aryl-alcohol dehydrogenase-like predicted oxidoreductase